MKNIKKYLIYCICFVFSFYISSFVSTEILSKNIKGSSKKITLNIDKANAQTEEKLYKVPSIPTGTILSFMGNNIPNGYVICNGDEYEISNYTNLANYIKQEFGSYDYFGGDGVTSFKVPDLRGEYLRGSGTGSNGSSGENVGVHQSQGLPNITGTFSEVSHISRTSADGAFSVSTSYEYNGTNGGSDFGNRGPSTFTFNASNSNNIYGNSNDIRPSNISVHFIIKY